MLCRKCARTLLDCQACNDDRRAGQFDIHTCAECDNTGLVCSEHGGHWR